MSKNSLTLRLTEPVIFLRSGSDTASRRRRRSRAEEPPSLLRGLLTLKLTKPTRISSIEATLQGISRTDWPDINSVGARHLEVSEENAFLSTTTVFFRADEQRRSQTLGPGVSLAEERAEEILRLQSTRDTSDTPTPLSRGRRERRTMPSGYRPPTAPAASSADGLYTDMASRNYRSSARDPLDFPFTVNDSEPSVAASRITTPPTSFLSASVSRSKKPRRPSTAGSVDSKPSRRRTALLSLSGLLHDVKDLVQGHTSRQPLETEVLSPIQIEPELSAREQDERRGRSRGRKDKNTINRIGEALGIEKHDEKDEESEMGWKEFHPGTYTYPIAFSLPSDLPPSLEAEYGSVQYKLKGTVHRPGAFSTKLSASIPVELVAAPADDDAEEGDVVVVERQWDYQLQYLLAIGGRNFPQGSDIHWNIQLMPLSKMKLHRLTFVLEEKTTYTARQQQMTRSDSVKKFQLLCVRHPLSLSPNKTIARSSPPLLPILDSDENSSEAVMLPFVDPPSSSIFDNEERQSLSMAHLLNPEGPWHLHGTLPVPQTWLHLSHKHPWSHATIRHGLKIYLRVERGDDNAIDPKTGRRKLFDIIIETPVRILSRYCRPDWASLPRYEALDPPPLSETPSTASELETGRIGAVRRDSSRSDLGLPSPSSPVVAPTGVNESHPPSPVVEIFPTSSVPEVPPEVNRYDSSGARAQVSQQFARLFAGFEDEEGELPPTYASLSTGNNEVITSVQVVTPSSYSKATPGSRPQSREGRSLSRLARRRLSAVLF